MIETNNQTTKKREMDAATYSRTANYYIYRERVIGRILLLLFRVRGVMKKQKLPKKTESLKIV